MENRLTDLEIRITHQEVNIDTLSDALLAQQRLIEQLQRQLEAMGSRLRDMEGRGDQGGDHRPEPPPPHY